MKRTAFLYADDSTGLTGLGMRLKKLGFDIVAPPETARLLERTGINVTDTEFLIGETAHSHLGETLHPKIYAALVAEDSEVDNAILARSGFPRIDFVYANVCSLVNEANMGSHALEKVAEKLDIEGLAILLSAIKGRRIIMCQMEQIRFILDELKSSNFMRGGEVSSSFLSTLAGVAGREAATICARIAHFYGHTMLQ
ncbi:MAG: hypothetical protein WCP24_00585 [bacterium]